MFVGVLRGMGWRKRGKKDKMMDYGVLGGLTADRRKGKERKSTSEGGAGESLPEM